MKTILLVLCALGAVARAEEAPPLSHEEIKGTVDAHLGDIKGCMKQHGGATGKLVVYFVIKHDGSTADAKPKEASSNAALDKCIAAQFLKWTFPKPHGSVMMSVVYPFTFSKPANLEKEQVAETVRNHQVDIKTCYDESLKKKPDVAGTINVDITVAPSGQVAEAKLHDSTAKFPQLETCIVGKIKAWQFPKPDGTGNFSFTFPFVLNVPKPAKKDEEHEAE
jgi:hypothetical protein